MQRKAYVLLAAGSLAGSLVAATAAESQQAPPAADQQPAAPPSTAIALPFGMSLSAHIEAGATVNPDSPANNVNFGQTFTDRANSARMNQAMASLERDLDPKNSGFQWGFKFQAMYGTDARVTHYFDELDRVTNSPYQWDITELDYQEHAPTIGGGTDLKVGQYPTPLGAESIDATANPFYSHSYIFNFGLPFKHTGILTTTHVNDTFDAWFGLDTGVNDSLFDKGMNNNFLPKLLIGVGGNNLLNGKLAVLALAHFGPENPRYFEPAAGGPLIANPGANKDFREYYDVVATYKVSDALISTTEANLVHDDLGKSSAGGVAQYFSYTLTDTLTLNLRAEAFADQGKPATTNFGGFVCAATGSLDYVDAQRGLQPNASYCSVTGKDYNVTYGELTLGVTYKPAVPGYNLMVRPELRYDSVIGGNSLKPFDVGANGVGRKPGQFTAAVDLIVGF